MATRKLLPHEGVREINKQDALVVLAKMKIIRHAIIEDEAQRMAHILWEEGFVILEKGV
jgi:hypothetical protein